MKMIKLFNSSDKPITNYRIEEAQYGPDNEVQYDTQGKYLKTGRTLEWSLGPGETLEFPDYVAKYLKEVYGFLEEVGGVEAPSVQVDAEPEKPGFVCKGCGQTFGTAKGIGLHMAHQHPELL